jgi:hypothetical protein
MDNVSNKKILRISSAGIFFDVLVWNKSYEFFIPSL